MTRNTVLLQIIARLNPAIWDVIVPMGPERLDWSEFEEHLDPARTGADQPLVRPAAVLPILQETVRLAGQLAQLAIVGHPAHGDGSALFLREVDDWCGTPPRPFPWPRNWPLPWHGSFDPTPVPWLSAEVFAVAALTLADLGARLGPDADRELRQAVDQAVDQLSEAAVSAELRGRSGSELVGSTD